MAYRSCRHRPRRIIEVGSGRSARYRRAAMRRSTRISVDRSGAAGGVAGLPRVSVAAPVCRPGVDPAIRRATSSTSIRPRAMPGGDVDFLLNAVPILRRASSCIFDIFLRSYPKSWSWRGYASRQP
jgi:hypothetical protein